MSRKHEWNHSIFFNLCSQSDKGILKYSNNSTLEWSIMTGNCKSYRQVLTNQSGLLQSRVITLKLLTEIASWPNSVNRMLLITSLKRNEPLNYVTRQRHVWVSSIPIWCTKLFNNLTHWDIRALRWHHYSLTLNGRPPLLRGFVSTFLPVDPISNPNLCFIRDFHWYYCSAY